MEKEEGPIFTFFSRNPQEAVNYVLRVVLPITLEDQHTCPSGISIWVQTQTYSLNPKLMDWVVKHTIRRGGWVGSSCSVLPDITSYPPSSLEGLLPYSPARTWQKRARKSGHHSTVLFHWQFSSNTFPTPRSRRTPSCLLWRSLRVESINSLLFLPFKNTSHFFQSFFPQVKC